MTKRSVQRRKNFLPALFAALTFWFLWIALIVSYPPESDFLLFTFHFLLFGAVFLTSALILGNTRLGFLAAGLTVLLFLFRYFQIGTPVNLCLLAGIFLALVLYSRESRKG